jgi:ABC-type dipeptide/oligopeptide/nickel transport system permease subunit
MTAQSQPSAVARLEVKQELYRSESLTSKALRRLRRDTLTIIALAVLLVLIILTNLAPVIERQLGVSYTDTESTRTFLPFGSVPHVLGTDDLGRDHLARLAQYRHLRRAALARHWRVSWRDYGLLRWRC